MNGVLNGGLHGTCAVPNEVHPPRFLQGNAVAVKVLDKAKLTNEDLHREAATMLQLRHPCIASIFGTSARVAAAI